MIQARRIGHATFETTDLDRSIDYYTQIAGLVLADKEKNRAFFASKIGQLVVQLERGGTALHQAVVRGRTEFRLRRHAPEA